jgi:hypothetical protein
MVYLLNLENRLITRPFIWTLFAGIFLLALFVTPQSSHGSCNCEFWKSTTEAYQKADAILYVTVEETHEEAHTASDIEPHKQTTPEKRLLEKTFIVHVSTLKVEKMWKGHYQKRLLYWPIRTTCSGSFWNSKGEKILLYLFQDGGILKNGNYCDAISIGKYARFYMEFLDGLTEGKALPSQFDDLLDAIEHESDKGVRKEGYRFLIKESRAYELQPSKYKRIWDNIHTDTDVDLRSWSFPLFLKSGFSSDIIYSELFKGLDHESEWVRSSTRTTARDRLGSDLNEKRTVLFKKGINDPTVRVRSEALSLFPNFEDIKDKRKAIAPLMKELHDALTREKEILATVDEFFKWEHKSFIRHMEYILKNMAIND